MATNTAPIKWAQRSDSLYLTIALPDVKDETIDLKDTSLVFKGKSNGKDYEVNIEFLKPVDSEGSKYKVHPRNIQMHIMKKKNEEGDDEEEEFWPRLLKDKALEKNQIKIDWDRYVDEDEEEEGFDTSALDGGMGMGGGMGGMGGMGGGMPPGMEGMMGGGMGGMPGMEGMMGGGMGGMDMEALMKQMGQMGGGMPGGDDDDGEDEGDEEDLDDLPELEES